MEEGILDINGDTAVCSCGGNVKRAVGGVPMCDVGRDSRRVMLAYKFRCAGCGALGYQGLFSFMEDELVGKLPGDSAA
jgi:hypothetical protein